MKAGSSESKSLLAGAQGTLNIGGAKRQCEGFCRYSKAYRRGNETHEVLGRFGYNIGTQFHDDASSGRSANGNIKVDFRV